MYLKSLYLLILPISSSSNVVATPWFHGVQEERENEEREMSHYERIRAANIARYEAFLIDFDINNPTQKVHEIHKRTTKPLLDRAINLPPRA